MRTARLTMLICGIAATAVLATLGVLSLTAHMARYPSAVTAVVSLAAVGSWAGLGAGRVLDRISHMADQRADAIKAHTDARVDAVMDALHAAIERYGDEVATDARLAERREAGKATGGGRFAVVD